MAACPFPIRGIQVDGGSEFMARLEQLCAAKKLQLFVLPPKCPQLNGAVERPNQHGDTSSMPVTTCPPA